MDALRIKGLTVVCGTDLKCRGCGTCCSVYGTVNINISDIFHISTYLNMTPGAFFEQYCRKTEDGSGSATFIMDVNGGCRFRRDGKCSIYPVRPDTCAMHPFDFPGIYISHHAKAELSADEYRSCFIRDMPDDLIIVPDLERMVTGLILAKVKELYLARSGGDFDEQAAVASHNSGMAQVSDPRMREMKHRELLNDMISNAPIDPETNAPALTAKEIKQIYGYLREKAKSKKEP